MAREIPSYKVNSDHSFEQAMEDHLETQVKKQGALNVVNGFSKYARRQEITRFLVRHELYKLIQDHKGCIAECGVYAGQGLMTWAQLSTIYEPVGGMFRHIYGFDTFEGFPSVDDKDKIGDSKFDWKEGDLANDSYDDLLNCIELYDKNRFLSQIPKVSLVKGDFNKTSKTFLQDNPHVLFSLIYLDFDLYEPTKQALEFFLPRCSKGTILAFDEINHPLWPGETLALLEGFDIKTSKLRQFNIDPTISYLIIGE
ncbi:MAG: hypothetical protein ACI9IA_000028 [Enterobacterales bacterium]|jgi:hypothetical protein